MICVLLKRNENGVLAECSAKGHAEYAVKGSDIVCSAVTILLRTTLSVLEKMNGIELKSEATERGSLVFSVKMLEPNVELEQKLVYAGDFLELGIESLVREYPKNVRLVKK